MLTAETLKQIMPNCDAHTFGPLLALTMSDYQINTPRRQAHYLAQIAHESGECRWLREFATGDAYEGRKDLGNTHEGDGRRYKGRGLIQLTGRANYERFTQASGVDYLAHPEWLERPADACRVSGWYWKAHGLNELADADDIKAVTRRVNGGLNGLADRAKFWRAACVALGITQAGASQAAG